jgi:hypothetical protein
MDRAKVARDEARWLAATIRADLWNQNRDLENNRPLTAADFMPGARTEEDEMREFAEKVMSGESFHVDPIEVATFRARLKASFVGINDAGEVTTVGPQGMERVKCST